MKNEKIIYDLAIIGAGPAGLMAGISASGEGKKVVIVEKNSSPGLKLLMTGNGRSNITNFIEDPKELVKYYGASGKFLFSSFFNFSAMDTLEFFNGLGVATKVERYGKVFPKSDKSREILESLINEARQRGAEILINSGVSEIIKTKNLIDRIKLENGREITAKSYIIATGGLSYPGSGSDGDGYKWARDLGHNVTDLQPALTPIYLEERFFLKLEGVSISDAKFKLLKNDRILAEITGDAIFTADGMSGPAILNLSSSLDNRDRGYVLAIDFLPHLQGQLFEDKMLSLFKKINNKQIKNCLDTVIPKRLAELLLEISEIDSERQVNAMKKGERQILLGLLKNFSLKIRGIHGFERAMITRGGINLKEVDPKTLRSKIIPNLYFAGEVLDLQGPTGGFNLQIAWSTGYTAGRAAINNT